MSILFYAPRPKYYEFPDSFYYRFKFFIEDSKLSVSEAIKNVSEQTGLPQETLLGYLNKTVLITMRDVLDLEAACNCDFTTALKITPILGDQESYDIEDFHGSSTSRARFVDRLAITHTQSLYTGVEGVGIEALNCVNPNFTVNLQVEYGGVVYDNMSQLVKKLCKGVVPDFREQVPYDRTITVQLFGVTHLGDLNIQGVQYNKLADVVSFVRQRRIPLGLAVKNVGYTDVSLTYIISKYIETETKNIETRLQDRLDALLSNLRRLSLDRRSTMVSRVNSFDLKVKHYLYKDRVLNGKRKFAPIFGTDGQEQGAVWGIGYESVSDFAQAVGFSIEEVNEVRAKDEKHTEGVRLWDIYFLLYAIRLRNRLLQEDLDVLGIDNGYNEEVTARLHKLTQFIHRAITLNPDKG